MKELSYLDAARITTARLEDGGVFLTVGGEQPNTMTLGWGAVCHLWARPVLLVLVRKQRYTYDLLRRAGEFTVSVPTQNPLRAELEFAGTKSGREYNKFEGHGLTALPAQKVSAPIVAECGLHFECRTLLTQEMDSEQMASILKEKIYRKGDYHTLFFGEILSCYTTD